jgi:hypothetical protein
MSDAGRASVERLRRIPSDLDADAYIEHLRACASDTRYGPLAAHVRRWADAADGDTAVLDAEAVSAVVERVWAEVPAPVRGAGRQASPFASEWHPAGLPQAPDSFDPTLEISNLLGHAEAEGIAVTWFPSVPWLGGFVYRRPKRVARRRDRQEAPKDLDARDLPGVVIGDVIVVLNPTQSWVDTFIVLVHELAHALLGHLSGPMRLRSASLVPNDRPLIGTAAREVEAGSVTSLVATRRGAHEDAQARLVRHHFERLRWIDRWISVDLLRVFLVAELLIAWCRARPGAIGVRSTRGPRPWLPRYRDAQEDRAPAPASYWLPPRVGVEDD